MKILFLGFCFLLLFSNSFGQGQEFTLPQTVDYINNELKNHKCEFVSSFNGYSVYSIEVNSEGKLIVEENVFNDPIDKGSTDIVPIKNLSSKNVSVQKYNSSNFILELGCANSFNQRDDCVETISKASNSKRHYSRLSICIGPNSDGLSSLQNAFIHLIELVQNDSKYSANSSNDPFGKTTYISTTKSENSISTGNNSNVIKMKKVSGVYEVPVVINDALRINFIIDSGASEVFISADVALTLIKTGTVKQADFIGSQTYTFADGSHARSKKFIIRKIQIGNKCLTNVEAGISNSIDAPMLLGQNVLNKFGKITFNYQTESLIIE